MIEATKEHHLTLNTEDERTDKLAHMIHNMGSFLEENLITKETYVHIHNILRGQIETENIVAVVGYADNREDYNEYVIRVLEFPQLADGEIHKFKQTEEGKFFLLTEEEEDGDETILLEKVVYLRESKAELLSTLRETQDKDLAKDLATELMDFVSLVIEKMYDEELVKDNKMTVHYEHEKLEDTKDSVLVVISKRKGDK